MEDCWKTQSSAPSSPSWPVNELCWKTWSSQQKLRPRKNGGRGLWMEACLKTRSSAPSSPSQPLNEICWKTLSSEQGSPPCPVKEVVRV